MLTPAAPPQPVPVYSGFDYVTVDAQRRRVYAAHGGSRALLVVDADTGKVVGQVRVGPMHGVAVDPATGHVFTGNGTSNTVSESDPTTLRVLRSVDVPGSIDAIAYDPANGHIYADEDDGTHVYVVDAKTFTLIKTITVPGHKPEYIAVNPKTHDVYQNIDDQSEIAVIDPATLSVKRTIATPEIQHNHPLQYDTAFDEIVIAGTNGVMSAYRPDGTKLGQTTVPRFDQCDLDPTQHVLACAGEGGVTRIQLTRGGAPHVIDTTPVDPGIHTDAIDPKTHAVFAVWSKRDGSGDFVQRFDPAK
ncbi:MAG TPA: YncE family protein [Candidatus Limnocylindria bacterium]|jgi:outer membrane protein assembly factor BamB|nr:YncE family protein [Candidatus Limnocylindria bacterium]